MRGSAFLEVFHTHGDVALRDTGIGHGVVGWGWAGGSAALMILWCSSLEGKYVDRFSLVINGLWLRGAAQ